MAVVPQYHRWLGSLGGGTGSTTALMILGSTFVSGGGAGGATSPSGDGESDPVAGPDAASAADKCSNPGPPWPWVEGTFIGGSIWRQGPLRSELAAARAVNVQS